MKQSDAARIKRTIRIADGQRTKKQMREYLRFRRRTGDELAGIVLRSGEWFRGRTKAADHDLAEAWRKQNRPRSKQCFHNAQLFCHEHSDVRYFEGFLWIHGLPIHHAWNVMPDGTHIDFTVEAMEQSLKREKYAADPREPLYCGVEVPRTHVRTRMLDEGATEPLAERYFGSFKKE